MTQCPVMSPINKGGYHWCALLGEYAYVDASYTDAINIFYYGF